MMPKHCLGLCASSQSIQICCLNGKEQRNLWHTSFRVVSFSVYLCKQFEKDPAWDCIFPSLQAYVSVAVRFSVTCTTCPWGTSRTVS